MKRCGLLRGTRKKGRKNWTGMNLTGVKPFQYNKISKVKLKLNIFLPSRFKPGIFGKYINTNNT